MGLHGDTAIPEEVLNPTTTPSSSWKTAMVLLCRTVRNKALVDSDWTRMDDNGLSDSAKASWATYRQELRDFPATWETTYDNMSNDDKTSVTKESIKNSLSNEPE
tara:strand:- start:61 stop:375 length:315 start_codon:yes stop_codon:yes gene_type:complete